MIWLTWRQFRVQALVLGGAVVALLLGLLVAHGDLPTFDDSFLQAFTSERLASTVYTVGIVVGVCAPAVVGVFWGAPLVARELEAGTHRLAWTQSVTRNRWLATKLAVTGLAAMATVGLLALVMTWWSGSLDKAVNAGQEQNGLFGLARIAPPLFEARGITPIAYTAFALVLGTAIGTVVRRVVPAMAITLAVFVAIQILMPVFGREHLGASSTTTAITAENLRGLMVSGITPEGMPVGPVKQLTVDADKPGAWMIGNQPIDRNGRAQGEMPSWVSRCVPAQAAGIGAAPFGPVDSAACFKRLHDEGYRQRITFMPASRYWTLQWLESAIFLGLAALLAAGAFWWLRHRIA
jgi:hypothetical protein